MFSVGTFRSRFVEFSRVNGLFGKRDTVIVGVSGGVDSMVLLDLLAGEGSLRLVVAHMNYGLRGAESDGDEELTAAQAGKYGAELRVERVDAASESARAGRGIQEVARDLRYGFFQRVKEEAGGDLIATGHQADDNAETILLHLCRGTGIRGMGGIPARREEIIRPLLFARREEIEAYAREAGVPFRTDSSNGKDVYTRNALRLRILPLLRDLVTPAVVENINRAGDRFREVAQFLAEQSTRAVGECLTEIRPEEFRLSLHPFAALPLLLREQVLLSAMARCTGVETESVRVQSILALSEGETGSRVMIGSGWEVARNRDELVFRKEKPETSLCVSVEPGGEYRIGPIRFASRFVDAPDPAARENRAIEYVDADKIVPQALTLRTWREGDAFVPLGMNGTKKLSDFFVDEKVPLHEKGEIPVLASGNGEIIWVCGRRIDDRFKITPATRRVLCLEFSFNRTEAAWQK
jgi:tRNA(Ile)-lysidine synthase